MKKILTVLLAFISLFTLFACTTEFQDIIVDFSASQKEPTKILVWLDDTDGVFSSAVIPAFNELYPDIIVEFQNKGALDSRNDLKTYGLAGLGADVFMFPHDHLSLAIQEDLVYELPADLYDELDGRILDVALDIATAGTAGTDDVHLYAVPISIESIFMMYNKSMISAETVASLDSWPALIAYAEQYAIDNPGKQLLTTNSHWADNYYLQTVYSAFGWRPHGVDGNDPTLVGFESDNLLAALTWLTTELKPVVTGNDAYNSASTTLFEQGVAAMMIAGPWSIRSMQSSIGADNLGAAVLPSFDGVEGATYTPSTFAGSQMVAVYQYSANKEAAIKFVEFLASDTAEQILYQTSNDCPALVDLSNITDSEGNAITDDPFMSVMLEQLQTSIPMPTIAAVTYYWAAAQTMVVNIWDSGADIATEQKKAEASYLATKALGDK
jgi:arabinogalactan oligomer/maltooligosaccharide transport system substrate-binding protein